MYRQIGGGLCIQAEPVRTLFNRPVSNKRHVKFPQKVTGSNTCFPIDSDTISGQRTRSGVIISQIPPPRHPFKAKIRQLAVRLGQFADFILPADRCGASLHQYLTINLQTIMNLTTTAAIRIAGSITALFSVFHLMFYWFLGWEQTLSCLNADNWAVMMTFNIIANMIFLIVSVMALAFPQRLASEFSGRVWLVFIASIYIVRIIVEFIFWTPQLIQTSLIVVLCGLPAALFLVPVFRRH